MSKSPHVVMVSTELAPFTGHTELGELVADLARALRARSLEVTVVAPHTGHAELDRLGVARRLHKLPIEVAGQALEAGVLEGKLTPGDARVFLLDQQESFHDAAWNDNAVDQTAHQLFAFAAAALQLIRQLRVKADVIHLHHWTAGFVPLLLRRQRLPVDLGAGHVFSSVYRPAELGRFQPAKLDELGVGRDLFHPDGIEFYGDASLLKAMLISSEIVVAPSASFSAALHDPSLSAGLDGLYDALRYRIRGLDPALTHELWDPATDRRIAATYDADDLAGKADCKDALRSEYGLIQGTGPLLAIAPGAVDGAALSQLLDGAASWLEAGAQLVFTSAADETCAQRIDALSAQAPGQVARRTDPVDPTSWRRLIGGADGLVLPWTSLRPATAVIQAMRYGTPVAGVAYGAIRDAIVDFDDTTQTGTGFLADPSTPEGLRSTVERMIVTFGERRAWSRLQRNAMRQRWDWADAAEQLDAIYREITDSAAAA